MIIDSHAHLDSLEDLEDTLKRASEAGVDSVISISSSLKSSLKTLEIARENRNVFAALGIHPHNAIDATQDVLDKIDEMLSGPEVVAVGETGLDYFYMNSESDEQIKSLIDHIGLGKKHGLPIVVHVRDADSDLEQVLKTEDVSERTGVIHCFTGDYEQAKKYLDLGFYISFSGIATFKKSEEIRQAAKNVPEDRILIETDSPYLAPVPYRGKPNEPSYVLHVAETIAQVRGLPLEELARITRANTQKLFNLSD